MTMKGEFSSVAQSCPTLWRDRGGHGQGRVCAGSGARLQVSRQEAGQGREIFRAEP